MHVDFLPTVREAMATLAGPDRPRHAHPALARLAVSLVVFLTAGAGILPPARGGRGRPGRDTDRHLDLDLDRDRRRSDLRGSCASVRS